jgi:hypothetical protein
MTETVILGIQPTFYLKKIDPLQIPSRILNGEFKDVTLESIMGWKKTTVEPAHQVNVIGTNKYDRMFTYSDRNNNIFTCVTTNNFINANKVCQWCRLPFLHSWIGIPYRMEKSPSMCIFYTEGCYCCFECVEAELQSICHKPHILQSGLLMSPNVLLEVLFKKLYPEKKLFASPHFSLHEKNGGALTDKEFYEERSFFLETSGIVLMPYKKIAIKMNMS